MLKIRSETDFPGESVGEKTFGPLRRQNLDDHHPAKRLLLGQKDT
jgi:hypothetical protein